jgi:hypothetical protein
MRGPSPVPRKARWVAPLQAPWQEVPWVPQSLELCLAQSLVPQLAQRKSGREDQRRHLLPQGNGRLQGQRNEALLLRSAARRKERRRLRSLRVRVEALRLNRRELHHEGGGGSQRAHREVRRPYERHLSRGVCPRYSSTNGEDTTPPG